MNQSPEPQRANAWWTDEEIGFLLDYHLLGAAWLHERMPWRSVVAIRRKAKRLGVSFREPGRLGEMCPECHENRVERGTYAARFGICGVCYQRERERRFRQMRDEEAARAKAEAARQAYYRARNA